MKRIFTLAFSIAICSQIYAAAEFFVKVNTNGNYTVSLNNQTITSPSNIFRFFDLYAGNYTLRVYENGINGRVLYNQTVNITDGYRTVAELNTYSNLTIIDKLPYVQKSWYVDNIITTTNNNPPVCTTPAPNTPRPNTPPTPCPVTTYPSTGYNNNGWNNNGYGYGYGYGYNNNNNYPSNNYPNSYPNNYPNSYPNNYPNTYPSGGYGYNGGNLMDDAGMQSLIQTMKNATFEDKMIEVAKTALKNRSVKTTQVHQLLEQFTFEQNKLEVAKYCYDRTIDKNNYYTLYNDFSFNNYSTQLDKYINSK